MRGMNAQWLYGEAEAKAVDLESGYRSDLVRLGRLEGALGGPCHIVISHLALVLAPALTLLAESGVAIASDSRPCRQQSIHSIKHSSIFYHMHSR